MYFPILCSSPNVCYKQTVKSKAASTCSHQTHHRRGRVRGACQPRVPASGGDNTPVREVTPSGLSMGIAGMEEGYLRSTPALFHLLLLQTFPSSPPRSAGVASCCSFSFASFPEPHGGGSSGHQEWDVLLPASFTHP